MDALAELFRRIDHAQLNYATEVVTRLVYEKHVRAGGARHGRLRLVVPGPGRPGLRGPAAQLPRLDGRSGIFGSWLW